MGSPSPVILVRHGTTLQRAERIAQNGPNPYFVEKGGSFHDPAGGFSTYFHDAIPPEDASAEDYARKKADNFPNKGGPVILEIEVPSEIVDIVRNHEWGWMATVDTGEARFEPGMGLEELLRAWPTLTKRIIRL